MRLDVQAGTRTRPSRPCWRSSGRETQGAGGVPGLLHDQSRAIGLGTPYLARAFETTSVSFAERRLEGGRGGESVPPRAALARVPGALPFAQRVLEAGLRLRFPLCLEPHRWLSRTRSYASTPAV